ncbi:MAG: hypothetical protein OXC18_21365 [Desulfurellaceae bacterium]|nr:hypothetical protein [Desulfurellaceae bacterium]
MELLANELSIHGQFHDLGAFRSALMRVMGIRRAARRYGRELHCHRKILNAQVTRSMSLPQAIQGLARDEQQSLMQWLTRHGPFWDEDELRHSPDEYLECNGAVVTDTAVGEAAYRCLDRIETSLVSLIPSSWNFSPAVVKWQKSDEEAETVEMVNYRDADTLEGILRTAPVQIVSWKMLANMSKARWPQLTFSSDCFDPLEGYPLVPKAAQDILSRLETLNQLKTCFDAEGKRTAEGHRLYREYFTGERAWFSDSSDGEKNDFRTEMTFPHPALPKNSLFCSWHGKVNYTPPLRIHFSWPVTAIDPLYVMYVGPKITRR